jgi:hypothetical protein
VTQKSSGDNFSIVENYNVAGAQQAWKIANSTIFELALFTWADYQ